VPRTDFIETEGTITRMRGHGFYTVQLANGHEVLARMSGRMTKNRIRVIQEDRVLLAISPTDWSQGRIIYRYK
jgi:translation initiation factor IF-1